MIQSPTDCYGSKGIQSPTNCYNIQVNQQVSIRKEKVIQTDVHNWFSKNEKKDEMEEYDGGKVEDELQEQNLENRTIAEVMEMKELTDEIYGSGTFDQTLGKEIAALLFKISLIKEFLGNNTNKDANNRETTKKSF